MVFLVTDTPQYYSDICEEIRLFINQKKIELKDSLPEEFEGYGISHSISRSDNKYISTAYLYIDAVLEIGTYPRDG